MQIDAKTTQILQSIEQNGVCVEKEVKGNLVSGVDMVFPHVMVLLCLRGTARVMYDMQELAIEKNDFGILMPGHFLKRISCSEDYTLSCVFISAGQGVGGEPFCDALHAVLRPGGEALQGEPQRQFLCQAVGL